MNPFAMVLADLRALRWTAAAIVMLVALAVAIGVAIGAQERALRQSSAAAADDFDLLIGAPGSQAQLLMSTVYLQLDAIPLMEGSVLRSLTQDDRVAAFAPIAFGDVTRGYPIIGTTAAFAARWGRIAPSEGRLFAAEGEAMIGADVDYRLGESITPSHGVAGQAHKPGEADADEAGHRHAGHDYTIVGRLPPLGSPWDRAILVPIESVWEVHGLGNGHAAGTETIGPPFDGVTIPGVPAIVVKPRSIAGAYALRSQYRQGGTMAFFPAEVLVGIYRALGDARGVLVLASTLNATLVLASILLLLIAVTGLRRRRYAVLRAMGAPRLYVLLVIWLGMAALMALGCIAGLLLGGAAASVLSGLIEAQTGLRLAISLGRPEFLQIGVLFVVGSVLSLLPAIASFTNPIASGLRG
ncbi:FtsX-like permease family protein [Bosea lathyri]|uniref:Putative ABC transport system permease protein n=1 Tax=Bosea lathyri TaxID=1036778 RepID=A0A1H6BZJ3_9HYPH|nr:FtsX-like permease family protein [Bosea lathyri]SEG66124.1 putative ABC transport system permease protein [Bosea lathyri]